MFELDQAIAEWRRELAAGGIKSSAALDELESHLREDIEQQMKAGTAAPAAFQNAIQRVGRAPALKSEFEKVAGISEAQQWKRKEIVLIVCLGVDSLVIGAFVLFNSQLTPAQRMSGLAAVALMNLFAGLGLWGHGFFPAIPDRRIREAICISASVLAVLWWVVFGYAILPRVDFTVGKLALMVIWSMMAPAGILAGLIIGLNKAVWKQTMLAGS